MSGANDSLPWWRKWILRPMLALALVFGLSSVLLKFRNQIQDIVRIEVARATQKDARSIDHARLRLAAEETAAYVEEHLPAVKQFETKLDLLTYGLSRVPGELAAEGLYCEFGVYTGGTINHIAKQAPERTIHGFDSFEGLPEDWYGGFDKGHFALTGLPPVRENVELHKGWFDATVPEFKRGHAGPLAFVHMDADLYSSTKTVFDELKNRFVAGTVIQFDEYFNYPGWKEGEYKAMRELVAETGAEVEFLGYCSGEDVEQVAVRIVSIAKPAPPDATD